MQYVWALAVVLCLTPMVPSAGAFLVNTEALFDANAQQFYVRLKLEECSGSQRDGIRPGNLTRHLTIPSLERYTASREYEYTPGSLCGDRSRRAPPIPYLWMAPFAHVRYWPNGSRLGAYPALEFLSKDCISRK
jgi:hypothetical protein